MADELLRESKLKTNRKPFGAVNEKEAPSVAAAELERLKHIEQLAGTLRKIKSEFPARKAAIKERALKITEAVAEETKALNKRNEQLNVLQRRHKDLLSKFESVCEVLSMKARNTQLSVMQKQDVWHCILRVAELVKGLQKSERKDDATSHSDHQVLETLMRTNEDRIVELQSQIFSVGEAMHSQKLALQDSFTF